MDGLHLLKYLLILLQIYAVLKVSDFSSSKLLMHIADQFRDISLKAPYQKLQILIILLFEKKKIAPFNPL